MRKRNHKLAIIVPFRDRYSQLFDFKKGIRRCLKKQNIDHELIIVEQDDATGFNRGKLLNIGFIMAKELKCDYVVFHDVDMVPVNVDYSYSDIPLHLATDFIPETLNRHVFDEYFGGVTLFPVEEFDRINGYSNEYWGWGYEDDDLLYRCKLKRVSLDEIEQKTYGGNTAALKFDGDSYVEAKNPINMKDPTTIFVSFCPDKIECDPTQYDDTYCVFSIPKFDLSITYNSYKRYGFITYNGRRKPIYLNSEIKPNYKTNIVISINPHLKTVTMFQDGDLIGEITYTGKIFNKNENDFMYIGARKPGKDYFSGLVQSVAIFDGVLLDREIRELSNNQFFGLTSDFGMYKSSKFLILNYDPKFIKNGELIDLVNNNNGKIVRCETEEYPFDGVIKIRVPFRRKSTFKLLPHDENGFVNGSWKSMITRYNQVKFYNEVSRGKYDTQEDGLSNCEHKVNSHTKIDNLTHVNVSI